MTLAKPCGMKLRSRLCLRTSSSNACTPGLHQWQQIGRVWRPIANTPIRELHTAAKGSRRKNLEDISYGRDYNSLLAWPRHWQQDLL